MTNIQLIHGYHDDFYGIQKKANWNQLERLDRHIYFLTADSTRNSCTDISFLLKVDRSLVRNRLCFLYVTGYVSLKRNSKDIVFLPLLEKSIEAVQEFHGLCVQCFYDCLCDKIPAVRLYIAKNKLSLSHLEIQFFTFLRFMLRATNVESSNDTVLKSIIDVFHLKNIKEKYLDMMTDCLIHALSYCLQFQWTAELEKSWIQLCAIFKYAIFAMCQQNF